MSAGLRRIANNPDTFSKHSILTEYGAIPIDYRTQDFVDVIRQEEPQGLDAVFDGMAGDYFGRSYSLLRRGGKLVGYGNPQSTSGMLKFLGQIIWFSLLPDGKSARPYSTGLSRFEWHQFLDDWAKLFKLRGEKAETPQLHQKIVEKIADHELPEQSHKKKNNCLRPGFCQHSPECAGLPF